MNDRASKPDGDSLASIDPQLLRERAEAVARRRADLSPDSPQTLSPEATWKALHELQVHQIELEMQNEEMRRAQLALESARARYFELYDLAPVGYCTVDEQGLILQANLCAASLLGVARGALVGKPLLRFIARADHAAYQLHRQHLVENGGPQACELRLLRKDGTPLWVHLAATLAHEGDGTPVLRIVVADLSERKRLDQALQDRNTELTLARQVADKANLAKSEFLSGMSHELRSPLNSILGFAQLMQTSNPPPTPTDAARIGHILQAGWFLLALINDVLDLASVESGRLLVVLESVSLVDLLPDCQAMVETQAQQKGVSLSFVPCQVPCHVLADPIRLKQVIVNLLSNAIKYNRPGGTVEVRCRAAPGQRVHFSVRDTGDGLAPDKLAQLFQPFNRLGRESGAEPGTGIGLVICRRLIELMQGDMGVESTVDAGSEFWFELKQAP